MPRMIKRFQFYHHASKNALKSCYIVYLVQYKSITSSTMMCCYCIGAVPKIFVWNWVTTIQEDEAYMERKAFYNIRITSTIVGWACIRFWVQEIHGLQHPFMDLILDSRFNLSLNWICLLD